MVGNRYYSDKLFAEKLKRVYEIATPRVRQYLEAEIEHVLSRISSSDEVLELGCGYGRVLGRLSEKAKTAFGIDTSCASLKLAKELVGESCLLVQMDAAALGFTNGVFDIVVCIQNGISAFKVVPLKLAQEAVRVTKRGGKVLFSSYSEKFWEPRLEWFELQAAEGLIGEIDYDETGDGVIVCKDGFRATTFSPDDFTSLASTLRLEAEIEEVDESSIFCEISVY